MCNSVKATCSSSTTFDSNAIVSILPSGAAALAAPAEFAAADCIDARRRGTRYRTAAFESAGISGKYGALTARAIAANSDEPGVSSRRDAICLLSATALSLSRGVECMAGAAVSSSSTLQRSTPFLYQYIYSSRFSQKLILSPYASIGNSTASGSSGLSMGSSSDDGVS